MAARRHDRDGVGAGDAPINEVTTRSVLYRHVMREEGAANQAGWLLLTLGWMFWAAALIGPAILLALVIYGAWWLLVPHVGRLRIIPLLLAASIMTALAWLIITVAVPSGWWTVLAIYVALQVVVGLLIAAWRVRAWGWLAVAKAAKKSAAKVAAVQIVVPTDGLAQPELPVVAPVAVGPISEQDTTIESPHQEQAAPADITPIVIEIDTPNETQGARA